MSKCKYGYAAVVASLCVDAQPDCYIEYVLLPLIGGCMAAYACGC